MVYLCVSKVSNNTHKIKKMITIKITNKQKYAKVDSIDLNINMISGNITGHITINDNTYSGSFGKDDFEDDFGFILKRNN